MKANARLGTSVRVEARHNIEIRRLLKTHAQKNRNSLIYGDAHLFVVLYREKTSFTT